MAGNAAGFGVLIIVVIIVIVAVVLLSSGHRLRGAATQSTVPATTSSGGAGSQTTSAGQTNVSTVPQSNSIGLLACANCTIWLNPPYTFPSNVNGTCRISNVTQVSPGFRMPPRYWPYVDNTFVWDVNTTPNGVYQLMVAKVGSNGVLNNRTCISCNSSSAPPLNRFKVFAHLRPQGDWIMLDVENPDGPIINQSSSTGLQVQRNNGYWTNLWMTNLNGSKWYMVTNFTANPSTPGAVGLLDPQWSPNGKQVAFGETYAPPNAANLQGYWNVYLADFGVNSTTGAPYLYNVTNIDYPGDVFYEVQGFTPNGTELVVQSYTQGINTYGVDLYTIDIQPGPNFGKYTDITNSPYSWDEHSQYSPDGKKIAWISSLPFPNIIPEYGTLHWADYRDYLHNEFFLMNANGMGIEQLTHFNDPNSSEYSPQFGDSMYTEWDLNGTQLLIHNGGAEVSVPGGNSVWLVTFAGPCGGTNSSYYYGSN